MKAKKTGCNKRNRKHENMSKTPEKKKVTNLASDQLGIERYQLGI
jgi:hypothetical protein